jgi:hypothetical protein
MLPLKSLGKLRHHRPRQARLPQARIAEQLLQFTARIVHQRPRDLEVPHFARGQLELDVAEHPFAHRHQPASAGLFLRREFSDAAQRVLLEHGFDAIGGEVLFVTGARCCPRSS